MVTFDLLTLLLFLLLASLIGVLCALVIAFRAVSRAANSNLTLEDLRVLTQVAKRLQHAAQLHPANEDDYLHTLQSIVVSNVGGSRDILVLQKVQADIEVVESPTGYLKDEYVQSLVAELDENTIFWYDHHRQEARLGDGRLKNALGYALRDAHKTRYVLQPIPGIPASKIDSLTILLGTILQISVEHRRVAASRLQAELLNRTLQQQVMNLFRLLAGINHNFRGIFTTGATEIMQLYEQMRGGENISMDRFERAVQKMGPSIPILLNLLAGIDDLKRIIGDQPAPAHYEAFALRHLFHNSFENWISRQKELLQGRVAVEVDIPSHLQILVDSTAFFQIVWNVLSNSFKYTRKGMIHISAYEGQDNFIYLNIADTGPGISETDIHRIGTFEFRTDNAQDIGGQGIGLWFSKQLLEMQAGKLVIDSSLGEGSTFSIGFQSAIVGQKGGSKE